MGSIGYDRDAAVDGGRLDGCASYLEAAADLDLVHAQGTVDIGAEDDAGHDCAPGR